MIRFGTIGTGFITKHFIGGALETKELTLAAIYSRDLNKAHELGEEFKDSLQNELTYFTDLQSMATSDKIDAVYIASPNSLHIEQAKLFLSHGKHVLVEKPAGSNLHEIREATTLAKEKGLVFMEGMKSLTMPAYLALKENLPRIGTVRKYLGNYCQYSSRYDRHKSGEWVNTFQREFSNGALMDIGVYCLYPLVDLFGVPQEIHAVGNILENGGVDGSGSMLLKYDQMEASLTYSKISDSFMESEIQGEKGSLLIDRIGSPLEITLILHDGTKEVITPTTKDNDFYYEALEFAKTIQEGTSFSPIYREDLCHDVHTIMTKARTQIKLQFPADLT